MQSQKDCTFDVEKLAQAFNYISPLTRRLSTIIVPQKPFTYYFITNLLFLHACNQKRR